MLSENTIEQLRSENELLRVQLNDLNEVISSRDAELQSLRKTAAKVVEMQSLLNINLDEFYYLQDQLGLQQQKREGAETRERTLEKELLQSIEMETSYYNMRDELTSLKAAFADVRDDADKLQGLYAENFQLKQKLASAESNLEIALLENTFLKEDIKKALENSDKSK